jgi:predicted aspartyl protease
MTKNDLSFEYFLANNGYVRIPLITSNIGHLQVMVRLQNESGFFIVDTGASITLIDKPFAKQASLNWTYPKEQVNISGGRAQELLEVAEVQLQIDQLAFQLPQLYVGDLSNINKALTQKGSRGISGVLGADILLARSAIIDYKTAAMYLKPHSGN